MVLMTNAPRLPRTPQATWYPRPTNFAKKYFFAYLEKGSFHSARGYIFRRAACGDTPGKYIPTPPPPLPPHFLSFSPSPTSAKECTNHCLYYNCVRVIDCLDRCAKNIHFVVILPTKKNSYSTITLGLDGWEFL